MEEILVKILYTLQEIKGELKKLNESRPVPFGEPFFPAILNPPYAHEYHPDFSHPKTVCKNQE